MRVGCGLFIAFFLLCAPQPAQAYLDPGTGSMVLQLLLAGFAGAGVVIKLFWRNISSLWRKSSPAKTNPEV